MKHGEIKSLVHNFYTQNYACTKQTLCWHLNETAVADTETAVANVAGCKSYTSVGQTLQQFGPTLALNTRNQKKAYYLAFLGLFGTFSMGTILIVLASLMYWQSHLMLLCCRNLSQIKLLGGCHLGATFHIEPSTFTVTLEDLHCIPTLRLLVVLVATVAAVNSY